MSLRDKLMEDMKAAMKAKEEGKLRLGVIRMVRSAVRNLEIDTKKELSDEEVLKVLAKEIKMRRDSRAEFEKAGRMELVEQADREIAVLTPYLPEQLDEAEVRRLAAEAVAASGAVSPKDMGKVMAVLMPKIKGRADGKAVNGIVRELLNQ